MDLLDSILNAMDAPPANNEQQKTLIKKQREMMERMQNKQKEELLRFRKYVDERMARFAKDDRQCIEFQPLDKVHRSVIHEIAENGGFIAMSFGREDVDRHSVVYKKEHAPGEDEVTARRNGDGWNAEIAKEYAERRRERLAQEQSDKEASTSEAANCASSSAAGDQDTGEIKPTTNYKAKYAHLIGESAALQAARKTETNQSYGFVPSKNKKDMRSIEQTLADIQAKKRLRLAQQQELEQEQEHQQEATTSSGDP
ncbi:sperm-associated antigen 7 [Drosophila ficusphila]|uniref:sperm-associated antigen 7 n=1 Tax=Drosophila ficusphila TaxID=30025 RepID=UPI0007E5C2F0|nr:sperm-associated antigen 7 [Drosophila ficusphila]XP_043063836.1 sperm-associated antigen 7 [Drosophila ficusphila]XP_043063837.1 sperm-associated antigen 7 [Drosophila ficusphila]XP_043063838.1 sperm-associated antigen 7 [Drosophila ficusphila]XP_043063839.1 sperm-associated antigen 7 [Drosophila ficusphila]